MATKYIKKIEGAGYVSTAVEPVYGKGHSRTSAVNPDVYVDGVWMDSVNGAEKVVNGTFDTDTSGWTLINCTLVSTNGVARLTNTSNMNGTASQVMTVPIGTLLTVSGTSSSGTSGTRLLVYSDGDAKLLADFSSGESVSFVTETINSTVYLQNTTTTNGEWSEFDNISVFETTVEPNSILPAQTYLPLELEVDASGNPVLITSTKKVEVVAEKIVAEEIDVGSLNVADGFDLGQSWVDVKSSRVAEVDYLNDTRKPIMVSIKVKLSAADIQASLYIDGVFVCHTFSDAVGTFDADSLVSIIPAASTYSVVGAGISVSRWMELR